MSKNFFQLTSAERDVEAAKWAKGVSFEKTRPLSAKGRVLWEMAKRGGGRPRKSTTGKARRVLVSMDPSLLVLVEAFASQNGLDRSELFAMSLRAFISANTARASFAPAKKRTRGKRLPAPSKHPAVAR